MTGTADNRPGWAITAGHHLAEEATAGCGGRRVWVFADGMSEQSIEQGRVERRAEHLLPEEEAAGSGDRLAQAAAILDDSDRRTAGLDPAVERRTSDQAVTPPESSG